MNLRECYEAMGADFDAVLFRLRSEGLIKKFVLKFVDDPSYSQLEQTMQLTSQRQIVSGHRCRQIMRAQSLQSRQ